MKILLAWMLFLFGVSLNSGHYIRQPEAPESFKEPKPLTDKDVKEAYKSRSYLFDQMRQRYEPAIARMISLSSKRSKRLAEFPGIPEPPQLSGNFAKDAYIQPKTYGMNLQPDGGYVWNNLNNPEMYYELGQSPNGDQIEGQNGPSQTEQKPPPTYEINNSPPPIPENSNSGNSENPPPSSVPPIPEINDSSNSQDIYVNINGPSAEAFANDELSASQNPVPIVNYNPASNGSGQPPQNPIEPVLNDNPKTEDSKQEESNPVAPVSEISVEPFENVGSNEKPILNVNPDDTKQEELYPVSGILVSENPVKPVEYLSSNEGAAPGNIDQESQFEKPLEENGEDKAPAEAEGNKKIPEAPVLLPLNYENLPDYIKQAISSTEKTGTYEQTDNPYVNPQLDPDDKKVMDEKMEEIFATVQPLEDIPKTYGMNLSSDGGLVWNDLANPPVAYDIGSPNNNQEEVPKESTTNTPSTSEQPDIEPGSESIKPSIPDEPIQPLEPIAPFEPALPIGSEGSIGPITPIEPVKPAQPFEPKPDVPLLPLEPVAAIEPTPPYATEKPFEPTPPIASEGSIEPITPFEPVKPEAPLEPKPDKPYLPGSVQPVDDIPKTYGMNLSSDGGHVWNDLTNPPVSYDIGSPNSNQGEGSKESTTNTPPTSEQPEIQPGSGSIIPLIPMKPIPDEHIQPLKPIVPFEPALPIGSEGSIEPITPIEPIKPAVPKPDESFLPPEPIAPLEPKQPVESEKPHIPTAPIEPLEPLIPLEPKPDKTIQPLLPLAPIGLTPTVNPGPVEPIVPLLPIKPTIPLEPKPEESEEYIQPIGPVNPTPIKPELPVGPTPVKPIRPDEEEKHPEVNVPTGSEEGETPKPAETEDHLEEEEPNLPEKKPVDDTKKPDIMNELLKSEQFWKWLGEWTATYMELIEKHIRKIAIQEICNHEKTDSDMCLLDRPNEAGPIINDGKLTIDGKEIPITHTNNLDLQRKRGESSGSKVDATTIYGNSVGNEKVTNVFIFNPDKTKEILDELKPGNGPVNFVIDERIKEEIKEPSAQKEDKVVTNEPTTSETEEKGAINEKPKELDEVKEIADVIENGDADKSKIL